MGGPGGPGEGMPTAAFARGAGARPGSGRGRTGAGGGRGGGAPPADDRLGAPNARLPQGMAAALEGLDSRKLARLTGAQLVTVVLHLLRIAVKHRRERALRHGEALEALEARRRQARARRQRAVQRQLASRGGGAPVNGRVLHAERLRAAVRLQALVRGRAARSRARLLREELARRTAFNDFCAQVPSRGGGTPLGNQQAASFSCPTLEVEVVPVGAPSSELESG